jgi:outer membrane protein assembly factor BamB
VWRAALPGPGLGAPANRDGVVYASFGTHEGSAGGLAAFSSETGTPMWTHTSTLEPGAGPAVGELVLLPGKDSRVSALDPTTGTLRWEFEAFGEFTAVPSIAGHSAYAGNGDGKVYRLDLADGGEAWVTELGSAVTGDPVIAGGLLVVGLTNGRVVAFREGP